MGFDRKRLRDREFVLGLGPVGEDEENFLDEPRDKQRLGYFRDPPKEIREPWCGG